MARALTTSESSPRPAAPGLAVASPNGDRTDLVARPKTAYKLTDGRGRSAYLWWDGGPVVESDQPAFRRRILRALKRPIWSTEDNIDEFGVPWSTRVLLQPDDPRYPSRIFFRWDQIGLGDLIGVEVVTRYDWSPVETRPPQRA